MKIIYHCFGGSHSSVLAAALHLDLIDKKKIPGISEMMSIPYFDKTTKADFGSIRLMGVDEYHNEIYVLGKKNLGSRYGKILMGIAEILGVKEDLLTVDCMSRVNWSMKIGGFTSRRMGWSRLGRPVLGKGTEAAFLDLVNLVEITRIKAMKRVQVV
ncbi:MAG: DUF3189 family protein [Syntrophomonas sp.]|uniref:DUF3189 family protein n=1 Tax=Syntrophomonas sp. TaxID=2053627 RepID=UPI0026285C63|nr:DUF3189 family protein [Syntrophomonas sp.]MDD4627268.1 DUF3189 family protein [Syntrophomonas sp.]